MDIYLTIMVTVLVATQVIRITQNAIQQPKEHDFLYIKGETKALTDWASLYGINRYTLYDRIEKMGWSVEKALETPAGTKKGR